MAENQANDQVDSVTDQSVADKVAGESDMFARPHEFRRAVVEAVWNSAKPGPEPDTRVDWRNGTIVGPWKLGQSRDGIWDMGHIEPWYKVVNRLRDTAGVTRDDVLDAFNDLNNLGVEDPETNRKLGVNSRKLGLERLEDGLEEPFLFGELQGPERDRQKEAYYEALGQRLNASEVRIDERDRVVSDNETNNNESAETVKAPKRVIIWDTETTGFSPTNGDKLVEIAAVEMIDGKLTGKEFHHYINPGRSIPASATRVHNITNDMVKNKPKFPAIAQEFLDFVGDAPLVAHNATFDMRFINAELEDAGHEPIVNERKIDTLRLAKKLLPEKEKHDLDTLAEHFDIDTSSRDNGHGGMIDTVILAKVYQALEALALKEGVSLVTTAKSKAKAAEKETPDAELADVDFTPVDRVVEAEIELQEARVARRNQDKRPPNFTERYQNEPRAANGRDR